MGKSREGRRRLSSVDRLPAELRARLKQAVRDALMTVDQLRALANENGGRISRSAIGRFKVREEQEVLREFRKPGTAGAVLELYHQLNPAERARFCSILRILDGVAE